MRLPCEDGTLAGYVSPDRLAYPASAAPARSRSVYAAVHVVADPRSDGDGIDWEATLAFRRHVWRLGLGVAEAMDTAQRGMGLDWPRAKRLIELSARHAEGAIVSGVQTDQLEPGSADSLSAIIEAYLEQCEAVEATGSGVVLMASRELCRIAAGPEDYLTVYNAVLSRLHKPAMLHWLGEMFDPALLGYWGADGYEEASKTVLAIVGANQDKVAGVKLSVLDYAREADLRARLPLGVRMFTGDDFDYPTAIADGSDALLGAFDFVAPAVAWALQALDEDDVELFSKRLAPTLPLARRVFCAPTQNYKTGVVFLAYLNGFQDHFRMVGGLESARSVAHLADVYRLADAAGLLSDPELAQARMTQFLNDHGVES